jgi:DNA-binding response OmpR family regulator
VIEEGGMASIALVDDNEDIRFLARCMLMAAGFSVTEAEGGRAALAMLADETPDALLLDVQMPDMDGWQTLRAIRENPATAELPVVLWTVKGRAEDVVRGWELGCDGYIAKPFDSKRLREEVKRVITSDALELARVRAARLEEARRELENSDGEHWNRCLERPAGVTS